MCEIETTHVITPLCSRPIKHTQMPLNKYLSITVLLLILLVCTEGCSRQKPTAVDPSSSLHTDDFNHTVEGLKVGLWRTYHPNGQLKREGAYVLGKKEGTHKEWSDTGILLVEEIYKNGKGNGLTQWFHEGGHLAGEGQMVDGVRQGPWKICDIEENGFCIDANFVDGKREGIWKIYHDNTNSSLWKEQTFRDDQMVAEKCFDLEGKVINCK